MKKKKKEDRSDFCTIESEMSYKDIHHRYIKRMLLLIIWVKLNCTMWSGSILADSFIEFTPSHSPAIQESYCDVIPFTCTPRSEAHVNMKLWLCVLLRT